MNRYPAQLRDPADIRWDFLAHFLPYGIEPTDIDLLIERNGRFLALEGKRAGVSIPTGQRRCLGELDALPEFTVVHFEGYPPDDVTACAKWGQELSWTDTEHLRDRIARWFEWADKQQRIRRCQP